MPARPFGPNQKDVIDALNDLANVGFPRIKVDSQDPDSAGTTISGNRELVFEDGGSCADVTATATVWFNTTCLADGFAMLFHVITGTLTINTASGIGKTFTDGTTSKTITAGNSALVSCDGLSFRIMRMAST